MSPNKALFKQLLNNRRALNKDVINVDVAHLGGNAVGGSGGGNANKKQKLCSYLKMMILVSIWFVCVMMLMIKNEKVCVVHQLSVPKGSSRDYVVVEKPGDNKVRVTLEGALLPTYYGNLSTHWMKVWIQLVVTKNLLMNPSGMRDSDIKQLKNISEVWKVPLVSEKLIGIVPEVVQHNVFHLNNAEPMDNREIQYLKIVLATNLDANFPVLIGYNLQPINLEVGVIYAALILLGLYLLIIFEIVHRTLAAMLATTMSVAVLAALNARPTFAEIISWIDMETLLLLFSMMILVTIFGDTGIFDNMAVLAYKLTGGKVWPLVSTLCFFTAFLSCFLDNVTTALLMTPVTIRLCEVMKLNPVPVLISTIIYSNIGGAVTPIGDPPNVIIASNAAVLQSGINFGVFTLHMGIGVVLVLICVYFQLRYVFRDTSAFRCAEPVEVQELKREIAVWKRAAASMSSYSKEEEAVKDSLIKRTNRLQGRLRNKSNISNVTEREYSVCLNNLQQQYPIKDKALLIKSGCTLFFVVLVFFLHSLPAFSRLGLGGTALLGAMLLLILSNDYNIESIFARVELSTLLFFAALFILMEALARLGLIEWIGRQTQNVIMSVEQEHRLAVAIILILWVSAAASAFVDNIPLTTMMVRIATSLSDNPELHLPLQPLIWALSFGACLGGNGSLLGSSSNIVCAGVAEQHGYRFGFIHYLKIGFPVMLSSMLIITVYLMFCHVFLAWH